MCSRIRVLCVLILSILISCQKSPTGNIDENACLIIGTKHAEWANGIQLDSQGKLLINGIIYWNRIAMFHYVIRLNSRFEIEWATFVRSPYDDISNSLCVEQNGFIYVFGACSSINALPIVVLRNDGMPLRILVLEELFKKAIQLRDSSFLVAGDDDVNIKISMLTPDLQQEIWRKKYSFYAKRFKIKTMCEVNDEIYVLGSIKDYYVDKSDLLLLKINREGDVVWATRLATDGIDKPAGITPGPGNSVIVCATTYAINGNGGDILILNVDNTSNVKWAKRIGSSEEELAINVKRMRDDSYIIVGQVKDYKNLNFDALVIRFSGDGKVIWSSSLGGDKFEQATDVIQENTGRFIVTGMSTDGALGESNIFLARIENNGSSCCGKKYPVKTHNISLKQENYVLSIEDDQTGTFYDITSQGAYGHEGQVSMICPQE